MNQARILPGPKARFKGPPMAGKRDDSGAPPVADYKKSKIKLAS